MSHKFKLIKSFNVEDMPKEIIENLNTIIRRKITTEVSIFEIDKEENSILSLWLIEHGALDKEIVYINPY